MRVHKEEEERRAIKKEKHFSSGSRRRRRLACWLQVPWRQKTGNEIPRIELWGSDRMGARRAPWRTGKWHGDDDDDEGHFGHLAILPGFAHIDS